jgi:hypothetical protein
MAASSIALRQAWYIYGERTESIYVASADRFFDRRTHRRLRNCFIYERSEIVEEKRCVCSPHGVILQEFETGEYFMYTKNREAFTSRL